MAHTAQRLQTEFLSCPRCSHPFRDPKALPCLHNLCKACLQASIEEQMGGSRYTSFSCPVCSKKIFVPDPSKATSLWAAQFPSNFVLRGMLDAIAAGGASESMAAPPSVGGQSARPLTQRSDRQGSSRSDLLVRPAAIGSDESRRGSAASQNCPAPPEGVRKAKEKLEALRSSVRREEEGTRSSLAELASQKEQQEQAVADTLDKLQEVLAARKTQLLQDVALSFREEEEKLRQRAQSCKDHLDSLESCEGLLSSVAQLPGNQDEAPELLESVNEQLEQIEFRPQQGQTSRVQLKCETACVEEITKALATLGAVNVDKEPAPQTQHATPSSATTQPKPSTTIAVHATPPPQQSLGPTRLHSSLPHPASPTTSLPHPEDRPGLAPGYGASARVPGSSPPKLVERISPGQLTNDASGAQVYDITVLPSGTLVMTVYGENIVQAFRAAPAAQGGAKRSRGFLGRVRVDSQPGCLCTLTPSYVAVVGEMRLYLIAVLVDRLELKRTIPTGKNYTGICAYGDSTLVASCQSPASVDFVGLNGFITETLDKDLASAQRLFKQPSFLAASRKDGLLYVADSDRLICLNNAGKVKYTYPKGDTDQTLTQAQGVCCDPSGFLYLVDRPRSRVLALSTRGTCISDVLGKQHGLEDPFAVAVDAQCLLYVTNDFMEILVFNVLG